MWTELLSLYTQKAIICIFNMVDTFSPKDLCFDLNLNRINRSLILNWRVGL